MSQGAEDTSVFLFDPTPNETYLVTLDQVGLDYILTVERTGFAPVVINSPLYRDEREFAFVPVTTGRPITISVSSREYTGATGRFSLRVERLTQSHDENERLAWQAMSEGATEHARNDRPGWNRALQAYERAAALWHTSGRPREYAQAIFSIAWIEYWRNENFARGLSCAFEAYSTYRSIDATSLGANALQLEAASIIEIKDGYRSSYRECVSGIPTTRPSRGSTADRADWHEEALRLFDNSRSTHADLNNTYDVGMVTNNIGLTYWYLGEYATARKAYEQAAGIFRAINEWTAELYPLANLVVVDVQLGYLVQSIATLERIIEIMPDDRLKSARADYLNNLSNSYFIFGDFDKAVKTSLIALGLHRRVDNEKGEIRSLIGLGKAYYGLGLPDLAADNLREAAQLIEDNQFDDDWLKVLVLRYIGNIEMLRGKLDAALEHYLRAEPLAADPPQLARLKVEIAANLNHKGKWAEAHDEARRAFEIATTLNARLTVGDALLEIGNAEFGRNDFSAAATAFQDAIVVFEELGLRDEQALAISRLASIALRKGDLLRAVSLGRSAVELLENLRGRVADPELRASYISIRREIYEQQVNAQMALYKATNDNGALREALSIAERATGRMMADLLGESAIRNTDSSDTEAFRQWQQLNDQLANQRFLRDRLISKLDSDRHADEKLRKIGQAILATENELRHVATELRESNPDYRSVATQETLTADEIQNVLDDDSVLLRYFLGEETSFVWVVTSDSIEAVELPSREDIDRLAKAAYDNLSQGRPVPTSGQELAQSLQAFSSAVLGPVWSDLQKPRILVSSDAAIQYIPFDLLPRPDGAPTRIIDSHEVVSVPSTSAIARQRALSRAAPRANTLAIFADPVLDRKDDRFKTVQNDTSNIASVRTRVDDFVVTRSGGDLVRLPATSVEADAIAALVPSSSRYVAKGFAANRAALMSMDLSQYRYIHFATHGIVDSRYSSLSSLVLSSYDSAGNERNGFVRIYDIAGLDLNAELVVLSACDTALGKEIRGEGLIGFANGFMYAGAKSLVVSLWKVPDKATAFLMTKFYEYLLVDELPPSEALRQAKLAVANERRWRRPYFWGAFTLFGDWQ